MVTREETDIMRKKAALLIGLLFMAICLTGACSKEELLLELEHEGEECVSEASGADLPEGVAESSVFYVHVCGAVMCPGVYELPEGSRIYDAVNAAGGFDDGADREGVNLVKPLDDGEQIRIPYIGEAETEDSGLIDINQADVSLLCEIPGIGESRAEAIVAYREENGRFSKPEELMQIPGIKQGLFAKIQPYIECK